MQNGSWETQTTDGSVSVSFNVPSRSSDCLSFLQFSTTVLAASIILSVNDDLSAFANICSTPDLEFSLFDEIFLTLISSPLRIPAGMILGWYDEG